MTEAEVAQQLIADLQANMGIIIGFIVTVMAIALLALAATLNNASRALREARDSLGRIHDAPAPAVTFRASSELSGPPAPARPVARHSFRPDVFSAPARRIAGDGNHPAQHTPRPIHAGRRRRIV